MADASSGESMAAEGIANRGPVVLGVTVAMITTATIFVLLRLISRAFIVRKLALDDCFMMLAWLFAFGLSFSTAYGTAFGLGLHEENVPAEWDPPLKKSAYAFSVLYNPALMATKTSILAFYLGLPSNSKIFKWSTIGTLAVVNGAGLALTFLNIFQCRPVGAAFVNPTPEGASCTDIVTIYLSSAPVNIITDLAILFLPMPILTAMRLPRRQKIILIITFGFGAFVTIVDVVRLAYLQEASEIRLEEVQNETVEPGVRNTQTTDFSWYAAYSFMWSVVEVTVGIMCASVPALKPLATRFVPHLLRDSGQSTEARGSFASAADSPNNTAAAHRVPSMAMPAPAYVPTQGATKSSGAQEAAEEAEPEGEMSFEDFLAATGPGFSSGLERTQTAMTNTTRHTRAGSPTFFDFVNMKQKKSLVQMTNKESLFPFFMVTILFLVWGFAYGLLDTLNSQFQVVARMSRGQSTGIHGAYFGGYLIGPLTFGRLILKRMGFKACYIIGLVIYACGVLVFWPAAVLTSFPAFLVSNVIVGMGLSTLEIAANPFIVLCGPSAYGEIRLNFSQAIQAIASICSPLLARRVLFPTSEASRLINVQWTYLGIALFTVLLAVLYFYVPLPEATDEELEANSESFNHSNTARIGNIRIIWITLALGVFSMLCYVGGQESMSTSFGGYVTRVAPTFDVVNFSALATTAFAIGRVMAGCLAFIVKPRYILLFSYVGVIVFAALARDWTGETAVALIIMLYFFEGPIFSIVFAQSLRGLGRHTKDGSAFLTAAISGGAIFPAVRYAVETGRNTEYALIVIVAVYAFGGLYPLYLNLVPQARRQVDPWKWYIGSLVPREGNAPDNEKTPNGQWSSSSESSSAGKSTKRMLRAFRSDKKNGQYDAGKEKGSPSSGHVERRAPSERSSGHDSRQSDQAPTAEAGDLQYLGGNLTGQI